MSDQSMPFAHPWDEALIGEVADVIVGGTPSTAIPSFWSGAIRWMSSGDVHQRHIFDVPGRITEKGLKHSNAVMVEPEAVAIALAGQGKTRGTVALTHIPICTNQSVALIKAHEVQLDPVFLYQSLIPRYEEMRSRSAGGGRAGLSKGIIQNIPVQLPHVLEQRKIARILTTVDDQIEKTEALIAKYQAIKQGMMHDLFTRGMDEHGQLRRTCEEAPELYKQSELGWIPKEWDLVPLSDCTSAAITYGIVQAGPNVEGGVPYIRTGDMAGDCLDRRQMLCTSPSIASAYRRSEVHFGEIVCAIRATVGKVLPVPADLDGANLTQGTARIAPRAAIRSKYLLWALRSEPVQQQFQLAIKGTTFSEITLAHLREIQISLPRQKSEQEQIGSAMDSCTRRGDVEVRYLRKLREEKAGLMQALLTGTVRVKVDEQDTANV